MVLSGSQISMRSLRLNLLFTPVDYIFVIFLTKCLSLLVGVQQGLKQVFSLILSFPCYFTVLKRWFNYWQ